MGRRLPAPGTVMSNPVPRAMTSSARFFGMTSPSSSTITWATSPYLLIPTCTRPFAHFCGIVAEISEHVLQIAGIGRTRFGGRRLWVCCPRCDRRSRVRDRKSPAKRIGPWGVCRKLISLARELRSCHPDTRTLNQWLLQPGRSRHGLVIHANKSAPTAAVDHMLPAVRSDSPAATLDRELAHIASRYGRPFGHIVALVVEYPRIPKPMLNTR